MPTSTTALLSCEDRTAFDELSAAFHQEYRPKTPTESRYVREMVDAEWRLQRVRAHMTSIQETGMRMLSDNPNMDDAAEAFRQLSEGGPALSLLLRLESQFRRQFDQSLRMLLDLRKGRERQVEATRRGEQAEQIRFIHELANAPLPDSPVWNRKSNPINSPNKPTTATGGRGFSLANP